MVSVPSPPMQTSASIPRRRALRIARAERSRQGASRCTAITTGALAAFAVFFKFAALKFAGGGSLRSARWIAGLELLAAAFVAVLGAALFTGLWIGGVAS